MDGTNTVTTNYQYNARRQLTNEQMLWGAVDWNLGYTYTRNGHLASQTYPGSLTVDYAPNGLGQPTQAGAYATGVTYHPNGGIASFAYGNGVVHTMTQNARQLPDRSRDVHGTGEPVLDDSYDYDANGNVVAISDGRLDHRGNRDMTYDGLNRLKSATSADMFGGTISYTYDVLDNIQTVAGPNRNQRYCYEAGTNRLIFVRNNATSCSDGSAATALEYDVQGNLTLKNNLEYTFDYGNRLRHVWTTGGAPIASYVYDGHGRRVRDHTTASKYSLYTQAGQLGFTSDARKAEYRNYIYLNGSLVATRSWPHGTPAAFTVRYQHTDALGTPVAVTDANGSEITSERSEYDPYGKQVNGAPDDLPGYTGHVEDAATGLTYMQQRYYDPAIGRFLSVDPVTADGATGANFNRYWYANNNPYRFTDPDGRSPQDKWYEFTDKRFQDWVHGEKQLEGRGGAQNYSRSELKELHNEWKELGEPRGKGGKSSSGGSMRGQRGFFTPGLLLKANVAIYLLTYTEDLNASELGAYDRWLKMQKDKTNEPTKPEPPKDPEPTKEPPPPPPPEKTPEKVREGTQ